MSNRQTTGLVDRVYREILGSIGETGFTEGQKLPTEQALAEKFSTSRPTIREALSRLRADGIIATRQGSGTVVVKRPDPDLPLFAPLETISDIQRCYEFRIVTEPGAAALAASVADDADLAEIERRFRLLDTVISEQALGVDEDFEFHLAIARATKNQFFTSVIASMQPQVLFSMNLMRSLSLFKSAERQKLVQAEHEAVLRALQKRDARAASHAMKLHLERARDRMFGT
ncbi:FadR/GntR family transcriptional regulator [Variovorax sp. PBL-E5]|uniref:FadR/GntR family transcriptional regulator n=1 Tax=Variovorax sp. PBL-E5 TaxID=434014 RepID=UPI001317EB23|nr:FadR/GntR family transcriptional regulator [Variovorax sp. PBL-E5]VTU15992.1 L-lactate utilization operon repressor [Variovorax sp. PBL-E5]